jgi:transposase
MKDYTDAVKARMVARLMGPHAVPAAALARETGISEASLSRWRQSAAIIPTMPSKPGSKSKSGGSSSRSVEPTARRRSGADKLALVVRAEGLEDEALGAFLRSEGVHMAELEQWRKLAEEALSGARRPAPSKELRALRADLARKEKALAETAALIVLKKKVAAIWGDEDDDMEETSE